MMKTYQKPAMRYKKLVNEKRVAAVCWGNHDKYGPDNSYWYDDNGVDHGFYNFAITSGGGSGCDLNSLSVKYYASRADLASGTYTTQASGSAGYTAVYDYILKCCKNPKSNENYMSSGYGRIEDGTPVDKS